MYHSEDAFYELDSQVAILETENERLHTENARLREALQDIRESWEPGISGAEMVTKIMDIARAALVHDNLKGIKF